jgi:hypothetical protein
MEEHRGRGLCDSVRQAQQIEGLGSIVHLVIRLNPSILCLVTHLRSSIPLVRYSHTNQELEYQRVAASKAGPSFTVGPNGAQFSDRDLEGQLLIRMVRPERFELPTFWFVARRRKTYLVDLKIT